MSSYYNQLPPPSYFSTVNGGTIPSTATTTTSNTSSPSPSSSIMILIIVIASAITLSASIYLLLRLLSHRRRHNHHRTSVVSATFSGQLFNSLPLFSFGSVTGNLTSVDCAICLSKFESHDQLRLLPLCCHAFHSACIDTWLGTNQTCPLCRSTINPTDSDVLSKALAASNNYENATGNGGSFRVNIGSVNRAGSDHSGRRSYSIGSSFEYVVDEVGHELPVESVVPVEETAAEVSSGGGRSWLRDYVDRIASSRALSFRSSGRFCSSRRSDVIVPVDDVEAERIGEEISQMFRWLSGV